MKRFWMYLLMMLVLVCPAAAEEADLQQEADAAYAAVLLQGASAEVLYHEKLTAPGNAAEEFALTGSPVRFTVLDMDANGVQEVILELGAPDEAMIVLTFHEGRVYAAEIPYRGMLSLKDDGTHQYSSGALDNGVRRLSLDAAQLSQVVMASTASEGENAAYMVNGEVSDEAAYHAFLAEQDMKLDALWYAYTPENVKLLLHQ